MSGMRLRTGGMLIAALATAALIVWAVFAPREAAAGWLIGFLFWSQIPVGSLVLSMIHTLTGGRWGFALRPVLAPAMPPFPGSLSLWSQSSLPSQRSIPGCSRRARSSQTSPRTT
jgi:hypothetical protein